MSHRRKSSHPLCKQKRICSVVDRVLAAKTKQQQNNGDSSEIPAAVSVKDLFNNAESSPETCLSDNSQQKVTFQDESDQRLAIPDDLFKDFQALKNATNLDTANLMRKLIGDYSRIKDPEKNDGKEDSTASEERQDISRLSEYYKTENQEKPYTTPSSENSSEPLDLSTIKYESNHHSDPSQMSYGIGQGVPSKCQTSESHQGSHLFPTNIETNRNNCTQGMYFYAMGSESFVMPAMENTMKVPNVIHGMPLMAQNLDTLREDTKFQELTNKTLELQQQSAMLLARSKNLEGSSVTKSPEVSQNQNEDCREVQFQNGSVKIKGTKLHPEIQVGEIYNPSGMAAPDVLVQGITPYQLGATTLDNTTTGQGHLITPTGKITTAIPLNSVPSAQHENAVVSVPITTIATTNQELLTQSEQQPSLQNLPQEMAVQNVSPTQFQNQMQELQKIASRTAEVSSTTKSKNSKKSNQMKLIAENTTNHGVYTSVLKLPWSRRTRTPKSDPNSQKAAQQQAQQQSVQQTQSPMVLLPVNSGLPTTQQSGVFIPATTLTVPSSTDSVTTTASTTTQPMMMVYPNASFTSLGRPVRKRGRPPKVPVLARMLAEANKHVFDMQVPNFFPNFQAYQQPAAIVLNVNNMVNTSGVMSSTNNMNTVATADANATSVVSATSNDDVSMETASSQQTSDVQQSVSQPLPVSTSEVNASSIVTIDTEQTMTQMNTGMVQTANLLQNNVLSNTGMSVQNQSSAETKTMTTTSTAKTESGALYQEMILSSKSLVNVQPRRRQTTTELLKSKSGTDNFICTSFRLRSLSAKNKEKKSNAAPGMKRRGRPPKRRLLPIFEPQETKVASPPVQMAEPQAIAQLYGQPQAILIPDVVHGETRYSLTGEVNPTHIDGMNTDNAPRLFDSVVDGNYDNPLLSNQFSVEPSQSDENMSHEEHNEHFVFSSDEDEIGNGRSSLLENEISSDESIGSKDDDAENSNEMFQKLFHCKVCDEIIPVKKKNEHREKHTAVKIKCMDCGNMCNKFLMKDQTENDIVKRCENCEKQEQRKQQTLQCGYCQEYVTDSKALKHHIKSIHPEIYLQQRTKLLMSRKHSESVSKDQLHMKSNELKVYECPMESCGKKFYSKFRIKNHMKKRHEAQQPVPCVYDGCKKMFLNNIQLQEHMKFKHYNVKGYQCSWPGCDEEFQTERNLKVHLLIHKDEKPLTCDFCDYRCRQKNALNWHVKKHHPEASNTLKTFGTSGSSGSSGHGDDIDDE